MQLRQRHEGSGKRRERGGGRVQQTAQQAARQRKLLLDATIDVVAEIGYETTRVADLLAASGVSRNAFYKLFSSKQDCFLATIDRLVEMSGPTVLEVFDRTPGSWEERMLAMLDALAATIVAYPAMARVGWIEVYAAGPEAVERIGQIDARVEEIVRRALAECPERADMPLEIVRAVVGGLRKLIHTRLREGREAELPAMMPEALQWMLSYRTPSPRLRQPRKAPAGAVSLPAAPADPRERILAAVTEIMAEKGYPGMAITEIASRASVSLTTFYSCFPDKQAAFVAAIERASERTFRVVSAAYQTVDDWPHAVAVGVHALIALFALDTGIARLGGVAAYEGGPSAIERRDAGLAAAQEFLAEGYELHPGTPALAAEAIGATVYVLLSDHIRSRGPERLYEVVPTSIYLALAPFVGSEEAVAVANERPPAGPPAAA